MIGFLIGICIGILLGFGLCLLCAVEPDTLWPRR